MIYYVFIALACAQSLCAMEQHPVVTYSSRLVVPYLAQKTPLAGTVKCSLSRVAVQLQDFEKTNELVPGGFSLPNKRLNATIDTQAVMIETWGFPIIVSRSMIITAACATYLFPFGALKLDGEHHRLVDISPREDKNESRIANITHLGFEIDDCIVSPRGESVVTLGREKFSERIQAHFISLCGDSPSIYQLELPQISYPIDYGFDASQASNPDVILQSGWYEYRYTT